MMLLRLEIPLFISLMVSWVSGQECGNFELTGNHGVFTSPNYPGRYDHKANCNWTITAPEDHFIQIKFDEFDVKNPFWECHYDYILVFYGNGRSDKFCTHSKPTDMLVKSRTNTIRLQLISDHFFMNGVGFSATYDVVDRYGNKLEEPEKEDEDEVDSWDEETTSVATTTTTTTKRPATTTRSTTTKKPTTTTKELTTATTQSTTKRPKVPKSTLISKITTAAAQAEKDESTLPSGGVGNANGLISDNPGAVSGLVVGIIIGVVLIIFAAILLYVFVRFRRSRNKRIHLSVIETSDDKELIGDNKVYKKQGKKIVRVPEAETFPL